MIAAAQGVPRAAGADPDRQVLELRVDLVLQQRSGRGSIAERTVSAIERHVL